MNYCIICTLCSDQAKVWSHRWDCWYPGVQELRVVWWVASEASADHHSLWSTMGPLIALFRAGRNGSYGELDGWCHYHPSHSFIYTRRVDQLFHRVNSLPFNHFKSRNTHNGAILLDSVRPNHSKFNKPTDTHTQTKNSQSANIN